MTDSKFINLPRPNHLTNEERYQLHIEALKRIYHIEDSNIPESFNLLMKALKDYYAKSMNETTDERKYLILRRIHRIRASLDKAESSVLSGNPAEDCEEQIFRLDYIIHQANWAKNIYLDISKEASA